MSSLIRIGPDGGPFVELDEVNGNLVARVPQDSVDFDLTDLENIRNLIAESATIDGNSSPFATDPHGQENHDGTIASDPHDNTQHSEVFLFDGENFDGLDTSELLNLLRVATQSIDNQDYNESVETHSTASGTVTIDLSVANVHHIEAVDNVTIEFSGVSADPAGNSVTIYATDDDGTGPHTLSWPTSVVWDGGDPVGEVAANSNVEVSLLTGDGGTEWRGRLSGEDFS